MKHTDNFSKYTVNIKLPNGNTVVDSKKHIGIIKIFSWLETYPDEWIKAKRGREMLQVYKLKAMIEKILNKGACNDSELELLNQLREDYNKFIKKKKS